MGSVPRLGRCPGGGNDNPLQQSCMENPCGQRRLVGYSPWCREELDTTEVTQHTHTRTYISVAMITFLCHLGCFKYTQNHTVFGYHPRFLLKHNQRTSKCFRSKPTMKLLFGAPVFDTKQAPRRNFLAPSPPKNARQKCRLRENCLGGW